MIGALLTGLVAGIVGRLLVPDMWSELHGPSSWLFSLLIGLAGALIGYLIFTVGLGIGDSDVFDFGGIVGAVIGVVILLPFVGIYARIRRRTYKAASPARRRGRARTRSRERVGISAGVSVAGRASTPGRAMGARPRR